MVGACIIPPPLFGKLNKLLKSRKALAKTFQSFPQEKKRTKKIQRELLQCEKKQHKNFAM
jgi:hypothetical protein